MLNNSVQIKDNIEVNIQYGLEQFERGNVQNAINIFDNIIKLKPDSFDILSKLGIIYYQKGFISKAVDIFFKALKINPDDKNVINHCCQALKKQEIFQPNLNSIRLLDFLKPFIEEYKNSKWLTIGDSAYGSEARYLTKKGIDVLAADINIDLLKIACKIGYISKYQKENLENLSFSDKSFDVLVAKETIHHLKKPYSGIYEMIRVARKAVIIIEPRDFYGMDLNAFEPMGNFIFAISEREIIKISMSLGLTEISYKLFNLCYNKYDCNDRRKIILQINKAIAHEDKLCQSGKKEYDSIVMVIFPEPLSDSLRQKLIQYNYHIEDLWYNISCPNCKKNVSIKRQGEWHCPVCYNLIEN